MQLSSFPLTNTVWTIRVRHKLKEELIENVRGFGYVMKKGEDA